MWLVTFTSILVSLVKARGGMHRKFEYYSCSIHGCGSEFLKVLSLILCATCYPRDDDGLLQFSPRSYFDCNLYKRYIGFTLGLIWPVTKVF